MHIPLHLRPNADVAERVLLPGDPGRALRLAQLLTDAPRVLNTHRGLWGYTGTAPDGEALTIQGTGLGGPSAAAVAEELIALGARRLVRVGTCDALDGALALGELVCASGVLAEDGTSRALGFAGVLTPGLPAPAGARCGLVVSTDLVYDPEAAARRARWAQAGALAVELAAAAILAVAARHGAAAGCLLAVTVSATGERLGDDALAAAEALLGRAGAELLGAA